MHNATQSGRSTQKCIRARRDASLVWLTGGEKGGVGERFMQ